MLRVVAAAVLLAGGALSAQQPVPSGVDVTFDVVSIKPSVSGVKPVGARTLPGGRGVLMAGMPIRQLIYFAYVPIEGRELVGGPEWVHQDRYDVEARTTGPVTLQQARLLTRAMLADRFKLVARYERVDRDAMSLVLVRPEGGVPRALHRSTVDCEARSAATVSGQAPPILLAANGSPVCLAMPIASNYRSGGITMDEFATYLSNAQDRFVVNKTGLDGRYEFAFRYSNAPPRLTVDTTTQELPPLAAALQQDLGLRLVPDRARLEVLVIDSIERPTPN